MNDSGTQESLKDGKLLETKLKVFEDQSKVFTEYTDKTDKIFDQINKMKVIILFRDLSYLEFRFNMSSKSFMYIKL